MYLFQFILLLLLSYSAYSKWSQYFTLISVNTPLGIIHGMRGEGFSLFLGIPYGYIDKSHPFGYAQPHPRFGTPFYAFNDSSCCPQFFKGVIRGTIDCLILNVYTPNNITDGEKLPVMVYIHGGAFEEGDGRLITYSPKFLIRHNVIVVSINYRLGPYGFLCFKNSEYSNQALKDQQLALRWVKDNIASFGGDSDNILLFGHSSGAITAGLHLLYKNENLFHKVILQSGQLVTPYLSGANKIGWEDGEIDIHEFIHRLSHVNPYDIIGITKDVVFRPCIDDIFVTKTPKITNLENIKLLVGGTAKEIVYFQQNNNENFYKNYDFLSELKKGFTKLDDQAVELVKHFYYDNLKENIIDFGSDFVFNYPTERAIRYYVKHNATVYRYLFSYDGGRNYMKIRDKINADGAIHGDELGYIFDMPIFDNVTEEDQLIIDRVSYMWTNFAKYGDPTPNVSDLIPVRLPPVSATVKRYINIDKQITIDSGPYPKHMTFWDFFYDRYGIYAKGISLGESWTENISCIKTN